MSISALEHHEYCPRQCALIHVDGLWVENRHTVAGTRAHRRVDSGEHRHERGRLVLRSIPLWSERLGLAGRADAVEFVEPEMVVPVEYKSGVRHGRAADLQLCAQALCLEEMFGVTVPSGAVWYGGTRRREVVRLDDELRRATIEAVEEIRGYLMSGVLPEAPADERCGACQLENHCLPTVVASAVDLPALVNRQLFG